MKARVRHALMLVKIGAMLTAYLRAAMGCARYEILEDDSTYYGEIPGFQGVWANAETLEECREELESVLGEWLLVCIADHLPVPVVDGLDINIRRAA